MNTLITYDVSNKHSDVKKAMKDLNYSDSWSANSNTYYLPNTTLWKPNVTAATVLADMKSVVANLNQKISVQKDKIKLERCIAVQFDSWEGIEGDKHSD